MVSSALQHYDGGYDRMLHQLLVRVLDGLIRFAVFRGVRGDRAPFEIGRKC